LLFRILKCEHNHISSITISMLFNHILWSWVHFKWMGICWQCIMDLDGSIMKNKSYHFICMWSHQNIKYICDQARRRHVVFCDKTDLIIIVQYNCMCCHDPPSYNMRQRFSIQCKLLYISFVTPTNATLMYTNTVLYHSYMLQCHYATSGSSTPKFKTY
jgi:hypothetical protein